MATDSTTFVSPATVQYVYRVFSRDQKSDIVRLNPENLPNDKHLFNLMKTESSPPDCLVCPSQLSADRWRVGRAVACTTP